MVTCWHAFRCILFIYFLHWFIGPDLELHGLIFLSLPLSRDLGAKHDLSLWKTVQKKKKKSRWSWLVSEHSGWRFCLYETRRLGKQGTIHFMCPPWSGEESQQRSVLGSAAPSNLRTPGEAGTLWQAWINHSGCACILIFWPLDLVQQRRLLICCLMHLEDGSSWLSCTPAAGDQVPVICTFQSFLLLPPSDFGDGEMVGLMSRCLT